MSQTLAPWRQMLLHSLHSNSHLKHSTHFQLATVRPDGSPANRTVVFRGFIEGSDQIQFTTDIRSQKIDEIRKNSMGEICWYFTSSWEQFRIQGLLEIIKCSETDPSKLSLWEKAWFDSSVKSRSQFLGPAPKLPCSMQQLGMAALVDPQQYPVDTFCLVTLDPREVDYLDLKRNRRVLFKLSEKSEGKTRNWLQLEVNP